MRRFLRLARCDLVCGLPGIAGRLVLVAGICLAAMFVSWVKIQIRLPQAASGLTWGEALLCVWYGMLPYNPGEGEMFQFPMAWFCLLASVSFAIADYPSRDIGGVGSMVVASGVGRWAWWLAKCVWVAATVIVCVGITVVIAFVWSAISSGEPSLCVRPGVASVLDAGYNYEILDAARLISDGSAAQVAQASASISVAQALLGLAVCLMGVALVQNAVALVIHPVLGMVATISILFASSYFFEPWLPGEYMLLARTGTLLDSGDYAGVDPAWGIAIGLLLGVVGVVAGGIAFARKDILGRKDEAR